MTKRLFDLSLRVVFGAVLGIALVLFGFTVSARAEGPVDNNLVVDESEAGQPNYEEPSDPMGSSDAESEQSISESDEVEVAPDDAPEAAEGAEGADEEQHSYEAEAPSGAASEEPVEQTGAKTVFQTTAGGCALVLDSDGTLVIKPSGNGQLPNQPLFGYMLRDEYYSDRSESWYLIHDYAPDVRKVTVASGVKAAGSLSAAFSHLSRVESVDLSKLDASSTTDLSYMFHNCLTLRKVVLPPNLKKAQNTESMFDGCKCLSSVDLSPFNGATLTIIDYMFRGTALRTVDLSGVMVDPAEPVMRNGIAYSSNTTYVFLGCNCIKRFSVPASWPESGEQWWNSSGWAETVTFPRATSASGTWRSGRDGKSYTDEQMMGRGRIADTYYNDDDDAYDSCSWKRLWGKDSIATMAKIVQEGWANRSGGTVVVATSSDFKDALAGGGLAGLTGGPVVLTSKNSLSKGAAQELRRLAPTRVYVAGGPGALKPAVIDGIKSATGLKVMPDNSASNTGIIRLWGNNSAKTSAKLALAGKGKWADGTAIIATNKTFKDALSAAPISYAKHWPILLASNGTSLDSEVISALKTLGIKRVYIMGGTAAVTQKVETQLTKNGIKVAERKAGRDGIKTSRIIADWGLELGLTADGMGFATANKANDALAGAALLGKRGSVLLLAENYTGVDAIDWYDRLSDYGNLKFVDSHLLHMSHGYVFGGTAALSNDFMAFLPR